MNSPPPRANSTHAYSIVTTSTALLTRSNSTNTHLAQHSYSPLRPKHISDRPHYRSHRHSRSLTTSTDIPALPPPPSSDTEFAPVSRPRTLSDLSDSASDVSDYPDSSSDIAGPDHPKFWTKDQLAAHFVNESLPVLADFVIRNKINGRAYITFSPSTDCPYSTEELSLADMEELYKQARKLRVQALKSRIMGINTLQRSKSCSKRELPLSLTKNRGRVKMMVRGLESQSDLPRGSHARTWSTSSSASSECIATPGDFLPWPHDTLISEPPAKSTITGSSPILVQDMSLVDATIHVPSKDAVTFPTIVPGAEDKLESPFHDQYAVDPSVELSIDELLAQTNEEAETSPPGSRSWGAQAWEDACYGDTVKKIPFTPPANDYPSDEFNLLSHMTQEPKASAPHAEFTPPITPPIVTTQLDGLDLYAPIVHDTIATVRTVTEPPPISVSRLVIAPTVPEAEIPVANFVGDEADQQGDVQELHDRIALLETRIQELELKKAVPEPSAQKELEPETMLDLDLPQYIIMAGIGICAIVFRRLIGLKI